jgi:putative spermidine/putrescine transport system ATP-binding protein
MSTPTTSSIRLENVHRDFGGISAVKGITFDVSEGEFVSLLGPSGCGKTTTLRMMAGFILPTGGRIFVRDADVTFLPPEKRNVGFVFQNYALWPHMTVAENIAFGLKLRRLPKQVIAAKIEEVLAATGLSGYHGRRPRELSGGQQQRVALARALAMEPRLLLMDEPLSNLDRALRVTMRKEIKALQRRLGMTTVYVTHDQEEALSMSDRVVVLDRGEIVRIARPQDVYEDPQIEFVADFVGHANFFDAVVTAHDEETVRVDCVTGPSLAVARRDGTPLPAIGTRTRVLFRPERVQPCGEGEGATGNVFEGRVVFVEYFGSVFRYTVEVAGGASLVVETHNLNRGYELGEPLRLRVEPHHLHLIGTGGR